MAEIKASSLSFVVDGKTIELKKPSKLNFELNKALLDDSQFAQFAQDPAAFAKNYDLNIDPDISAALAQKLQGVKSVRDLIDINASSATAWAVAEGAFSFASSKVAVAY
ncbi:hypothetical protein [Burkholderia sp. B21-007]|uniref:hypothetical protein n=1 Tax=Burkholderia sp. B21-007 TaxID=2890407 RepID=UPI001E44CD9A|nr:hypothetical protein [Burkholderia sp. B21-007]UEP27019.1 hypothetical protein LMA01_11985 [Burkholderia sp. B21-007]